MSRLKYNTKRDLANIRECLQIGCEILRGAGVHFWLSDGALLALMREGEVFEHDHDWDIGIWWDEKLDKDILGFLRRFPFEMLGWSREIIFNHYQGQAYLYKDWIFDLRFWHEVDDYLVNAQFYPTDAGWQIGTFYESKRLFADLGELDYHGVKVPIPNPVEDYLAERYGADWKTFELTGENRWWLYSKSFKKDNKIWEKVK